MIRFLCWELRCSHLYRLLLLIENDTQQRPQFQSMEPSAVNQHLETPPMDSHDGVASSSMNAETGESDINRFQDKDNSEEATKSREISRRLLFQRVALVIFAIILFVEGIIAAQASTYLTLTNGTSVIAFFGVLLFLPTIIMSKLPFKVYMILYGVQIVFGVIALACAATAYNSFPMDLQSCTYSFSYMGMVTAYESFGSSKYALDSLNCANGAPLNNCNCVNKAVTHCYSYAYASSNHCDLYLKTIPSVATNAYNLAVCHLLFAVLFFLIFPRYFSSSDLPSTLSLPAVLGQSKSKGNQGFNYDHVDNEAPIVNPLQSKDVIEHEDHEYEDNSV